MLHEKEVKKLLVNSGFADIIHDFKSEKDLSYEELYAVYCQYLSTLQFHATKERGLS